MGIIRSTKAHYRKALVKYCLLKIEEKGEIIMPTIKNAIIMIKNALKEVKLYYIICSVVYTCISVYVYMYMCICVYVYMCIGDYWYMYSICVYVHLYDLGGGLPQ